MLKKQEFMTLHCGVRISTLWLFEIRKKYKGRKIKLRTLRYTAFPW
ncbi:MAG: hypothetical protein ACRD18_01420 [Terriglobia bacterium]